MENLSRQLQDTALFCELPESVIREQLVRHGHCQEYAKGQFLIEPQQQVNSLGVVLSGKVHMMHLFPEGSYSLMSVLTPGRTLGADPDVFKDAVCPPGRNYLCHFLLPGGACGISLCQPQCPVP